MSETLANVPPDGAYAPIAANGMADAFGRRSNPLPVA